MKSRFPRLLAASFFIAAGAACSPVQSHSGFRADYNNTEIPPPQVGVDTKETVTRRFGSPSTTAVFDQTAWYYLSSTQEQVAFYSPNVTERRVMVVKFDGETVSAVDNYGIERGRMVAYNETVTPTRGRELGLLEQIFGNIGSTPPIRTGEEDQGGPRRQRD